ncbi:MAG: hypothetical protein WC592_03320 [Candidatus Omnitrophota bacterium]
MRRYLTVFVLFLAAATVCAQDNIEKKYDEKSGGSTTKTTIRPGMEIKKIGGLNMVVPEGTQIYRKGAQLMIESPEDYSARNIKEMKTRVENLEKEQAGMKDDIETLKKALEASGRRSDNSI